MIKTNLTRRLKCRLSGHSVTLWMKWLHPWTLLHHLSLNPVASSLQPRHVCLFFAFLTVRGNRSDGHNKGVTLIRLLVLDICLGFSLIPQHVFQGLVGRDLDFPAKSNTFGLHCEFFFLLFFLFELAVTLSFQMRHLRLCPMNELNIAECLCSRP